MPQKNGDPTEKPTQKRLREARERGDIPYSPELMGSAIALIALIAAGMQAGTIVAALRALLVQGVAAAARPGQLDQATIAAQMRSMMTQGMLPLLPLAVATMVGVVALGAISTRGFLSPRKALPNARKLNPLNNVRSLVSREALILLAKTLLKLGVAGLVAWVDAPHWAQAVAALPLLQGPGDVGLLWGDMFALLLRLTAAFAVIGVADQGYRYVSWQRRLRMTREEIKEEAKSTEGNPHLRARRRAVAIRRLRDLAESASVRHVRQATVVVTNPTHYAVAIQYVDGQTRPPRVIAKGRDIVALRIKDVARQHNVPIVENKLVAQALYKTVRIQREIPPELWRAVAEVITFVYQLRSQARRTARPIAQGGVR